MGDGGGTEETVRYSSVLHLFREAHVPKRVIGFRHKHSPIKK